MSTPDLSSQKLTERANEIMLKLLDGLEKDIDNSKGVNRLAVYEALCRAEAARRGTAP